LWSSDPSLLGHAGAMSIVGGRPVGIFAFTEVADGRLACAFGGHLRYDSPSPSYYDSEFIL
jgi:hypothetical protein